VHDHACDSLRYMIVTRHGVLDAPDISALNEPADSTGAFGYGGGSIDLEDF